MKRNRIFALVLVLTMLLHSMIYAETEKASAASDKKYLILVEQTEGHWIDGLQV